MDRVALWLAPSSPTPSACSGLTNAQLKFHLGLVTPAHPVSGAPCARLRVANETRAWAAGRALLFDDRCGGSAGVGWDAGVAGDLGDLRGGARLPVNPVSPPLPSPLLPSPPLPTLSLLPSPPLSPSSAGSTRCGTTATRHPLPLLPLLPLLRTPPPPSSRRARGRSSSSSLHTRASTRGARTAPSEAS